MNSWTSARTVLFIPKICKFTFRLRWLGRRYKIYQKISRHSNFVFQNENRYITSWKTQSSWYIPGLVFLSMIPWKIQRIFFCQEWLVCNIKYILQLMQIIWNKRSGSQNILKFSSFKTKIEALCLLRIYKKWHQNGNPERQLFFWNLTVLES